MLRFPVKIQDFKIGDFIVKMVELCSKMKTNVAISRKKIKVYAYDFLR